MSLIRIEHLYFTYDGGSEPVFEDLDLQLDTDWKLGLVGRNGRGKTTLLRLLEGGLEHRGQIRTGLACRRFPCAVRETEVPVSQVLRDISPEAEEWQLVRELSLLGLDEEVLERTFSHPERRGADPGAPVRPVSGRGELAHAGRAHRPPGRGGAGAACPISQPQPPGLPACLPRPGVSGPVRGPCAGPEPDGAGAGEGKFLRVVPGEAGPGPAGAGPEPAAEGGDPSTGAGGPPDLCLVRPGGKDQIRQQKFRDCAPTGVCGPQVGQDDEEGQEPGEPAGVCHPGEGGSAPRRGAGRAPEAGPPGVPQCPPAGAGPRLHRLRRPGLCAARSASP